MIADGIHFFSFLYRVFTGPLDMSIRRRQGSQSEEGKQSILRPDDDDKYKLPIRRTSMAHGSASFRPFRDI